MQRRILIAAVVVAILAAAYYLLYPEPAPFEGGIEGGGPTPPETGVETGNGNEESLQTGERGADPAQEPGNGDR